MKLQKRIIPILWHVLSIINVLRLFVFFVSIARDFIHSVFIIRNKILAHEITCSYTGKSTHKTKISINKHGFMGGFFVRHYNLNTLLLKAIQTQLS